MHGAAKRASCELRKARGLRRIPQGFVRHAGQKLVFQAFKVLPHVAIEALEILSEWQLDQVHRRSLAQGLVQRYQSI